MEGRERERQIEVTEWESEGEGREGGRQRKGRTKEDRRRELRCGRDDGESTEL